jgi:hypothetical protein
MVFDTCAETTEAAQAIAARLCIPGKRLTTPKAAGAA